MPYNPSTSRAECNYHAGLVNQDSKNQPQTSNRESYNTFDKRHSVADTQLFDEVRPFYMDVANSGDVKRARMTSNDWSPVTKSQILSRIRKHRALFQVPWSVICPNTWEYLFREPVQGSDIVWTNVAPGFTKASLTDFLTLLLRPNYVDSVHGVSKVFSAFVSSVWLFNNAFSSSSPLSSLGVRILPESSFTASKCRPSDVFSRLCEFMADGVDIVVGGETTHYTAGPTYTYTPSVVSSVDGSNRVINVSVKSPGDAFNLIRDYMWYSHVSSSSSEGSSLLSFSTNVSTSADIAAVIRYVLYGTTTYAASVSTDFAEEASALFTQLAKLPSDYFYNLMPVVAYQCLWHQFFTNDRVDAIYSARMWQESLLSTVAFDLINDPNNSRFVINGVRVSYDAFSAAMLSLVVSPQTENWTLRFDFLNELFSIRPSLRESDYFTSMRVAPLAVGDVNVSVNSNVVSAIDVNQSLWYQRFLNAVNRTKQSIYDYLQSMTGVRPERVEPQPNFIVEEVFDLAGVQIDNNAESQGKIVSILRNSQSNYLYDIFIDEPSFIIGVDSFSVNYVYPDYSNRVSRISDRLDWFNDFMQHVGDQAVRLSELFVPSDMTFFDNPIGYQLRYAEFKNMVSRACGGFLSDDTDLASWLMLYSPARIGEASFYGSSYISPYFIRNHASDFDVLFDSLTGTNMANRFHIIKYTFVDEYDNSKQQAYPSLL